MKKLTFGVYGGLAYLSFVAAVLYAVGFAGSFGVPKSIDSGAPVPLGEALVVNLALLALFAVQHSVMARASFKRMWTRVVPAALERSTFVLAASAALALLFWQWRPMPEQVWAVSKPAAIVACRTVFWLGWSVLFVSSFLIDHFELFGLRQAFAGAREKTVLEGTFRTPGFYRYVRHPIYVGFILAFWATPSMSAGHLLFAVGTTGYILLGIWFEERDLIAKFGDSYRSYRRQVGMLLPWRHATRITIAPNAGDRATPTPVGAASRPSGHA